MALACSDGRCEVSVGLEETLGSWFGLQRESPGTAQQSEEETSVCWEQLWSRPGNILASYHVGVTLKTLTSSSVSLLAYFHEVLRHLQNVFFIQ